MSVVGERTSGQGISWWGLLRFRMVRGWCSEGCCTIIVSSSCLGTGGTILLNTMDVVFSSGVTDKIVLYPGDRPFCYLYCRPCKFYVMFCWIWIGGVTCLYLSGAKLFYLMRIANGDNFFLIELLFFFQLSELWLLFGLKEQESRRFGNSSVFS